MVSSYLVDPSEFGLQRVNPKELVGGGVEDNAAMTRDILRGRKGPKRDIVCLNAAPALVAGRKAKTLQEGFQLAQRTIETGAAMDKLERLIGFTKKGERVS